MATPTIDKFITAIGGFLQTKNAAGLQDFLRCEPPVSDEYYALGQEVKQRYPSAKEENVLEEKINTLLPDGNDKPGVSWPAFNRFMKSYLVFWRDVGRFENLLKTYDLITGLVMDCTTALSHQSNGVLVLPTIISLSASLSRLALNLEDYPDLTRHLPPRPSADGSSKTLPEITAEILQRAWIVCLQSKNESIGETEKGSGGRKSGIYKLANIILNLLFRTGKIRTATQLITNIGQLAPPLSIYPVAQRVTYLYYLGRYLFAYTQFLRSLNALQAAYDQCHAKSIKQRRAILIYLIAANIILGRFPTQSLLQREEAKGLAQKFLPVCQAISRGDVTAFQNSLNRENCEWFRKRGILLPLQNRCQPWVWRSLGRRTFVISGFRGDGKLAPTLDLSDVLHLALSFAERNPYKKLPYICPDLESGEDEEPTELNWNLWDIEAIFCSLIEQGYLKGYVSHRQKRFAIIRGDVKDPALAHKVGFPQIWATVLSKAKAKGEEDFVPAWVKETPKSVIAQLFQSPPTQAPPQAFQAPQAFQQAPQALPHAAAAAAAAPFVNPFAALS